MIWTRRTWMSLAAAGGFIAVAVGAFAAHGVTDPKAQEWLRTGDSHTSVADGLAHTARVITAAAAIMVFVFGSFLLEESRVVKLMGAGLAVAVLLDATIVRMVLVPATMELLGDRNWWLPRWLDRLLPHVDVEGVHLAGGEDEPTGELVDVG